MEEENGTEDAPEFDFETFGLEDDEVVESQPAGTEETEPSENGYPGTWSPILDKLPKEFHSLVAPELTKWDQGVNSRFQTLAEKNKPWKQFEDAGISPESLLNSYAVAQRMEQDPPGFLEDLKATLIERGMYQEAQQVQEKIDDTTEEEDPYDRRLNEIAQNQQQMQQALFAAQQQAVQAQAAQQAEYEIQQEFSAVEAKVGTLPPRVKVELANRAIVMGQRYGRDVSMSEAFDDLSSFVSNMRKTSPGARAPKVSPGSGGIPVDNSEVDLGTTAGREANNRRIAQKFGLTT